MNDLTADKSNVFVLTGEIGIMEHGQSEIDRDQDEAVLNFDIDDATIELAATGVGTIPTASVNMVPPNCCVQQRR
jgi:hypothetical protein